MVNKKEKTEITKDKTFYEVMQKYPELAEDLMLLGMHCCGCPMAAMETIEQGCLAHGLNPDKVVKKLNEKIRKKS